MNQRDYADQRGGGDSRLARLEERMKAMEKNFDDHEEDCLRFRNEVTKTIAAVRDAAIKLDVTVAAHVAKSGIVTAIVIGAIVSIVNVAVQLTIGGGK